MQERQVCDSIFEFEAMDRGKMGQTKCTVMVVVSPSILDNKQSIFISIEKEGKKTYLGFEMHMRLEPLLVAFRRCRVPVHVVWL